MRILCCLLLALYPSLAAGMDLSASGGWGGSVDRDDLVSGAGSDLVGSQESPSATGTLTVSNTAGPADTWRVDVRRADTTWPAAVALQVRRTSAGSGAGSISGGAVYDAVEAFDRTFFTGSGDRGGVELQYRVTGVSVQVSPNLYSTAVVFTVVDTD